MLDKENNYNIDEQFTQDAWLQMEQMLSKEMPVQEKKKRRGAFWIWFAGLGVLLLSLGVWAIYSNDTEDPIIASTTVLNNELKTEKNKLKETKPIENIISNSSSKNSTLNSNNTQTKTTNITSSESKSKIEKPLKTNPKNNTTTTNTSTQPDYQTGRQYNSVDISPQKPIVSESRISPPVSTSQEEGAKASILNNILPLNLEKETKEKTTAKEEEPIVSINKPLNINTLSMLSLNEIAMKEREPSLRLPIEIESSTWRKSNLSWELEVGTQSANLQNLNGFFAGALLNVKLNSRWFISTGIRYNYNRYETEPLNLGQKDDLFSAPGVRMDNDTSGVNNNPDPVGNGAYQEIYDLLKTQASFHAFSLPLSLNYRLNSRWSVNGGGHISYLLGAGQSIQGSSLLSSLDTEALGNNFGTAVAESITRRWDFAVRTGVHYDINDRMGAGLNYHTLLNRNKGTNNRETLQNSVLQLSLNYKFR